LYLVSIAALLSPFYLLAASLVGVPGITVHLQSIRLGLLLLFRRQGPLSLKTMVLMILYPLDSTRYFEVDFVQRALAAGPIGTYLDVSSPRLIFTLPLFRHKHMEADLINPDKADLAETVSLLRACGLLSRTRLHNTVIENAPLVPETFDLITSISVLEHIPEDRQAIQKIWELLKPGGRLLLTLPCAAKTSEQYIDQDEYGLYGGGEGGHVFWQRFYDDALLEDRIYRVTGRPQRIEIFGERSAGLFLRMATRKRMDRYYPFWREAYMTAREYSFYKTLAELPGEGVIAMEFVKP